MSFDIDADVAQSRATMDAAHEQDKVAAIQTGNMTSASAPDVDPVRDWMTNLPRNVSVAVMDAAANTVDAAKVFGDHVWANLKAPGAAQEYANTEQGKTPQGETPEQLREKFLAQPMVQETHGPARQAFMAFRDEMAAGSSTSDEITQGIAQFAVPFLGWSKLLGVHKAISVGAALAEGATASTALAPHAGRTADLLAYGKQVEGKLGDTLNTIAPDGSALNAYINYMTDRTNESDAEGRWKNVIDSLVTTATGATLIKTGAATLKTGMRLPGYIAENAGTGPVGLGAQEGKIVFHGTQHDFNEFDNSKIGTGEGAQVFGHGLYFAENPAVAGEYKQAGGPYLSVAGKKVFAEEMDGEPIQGPVKDLLMEAHRRGFTPAAAQSYGEREIKTNAAEWGLNNRTEQMQALDLLRKTSVVSGRLMHVDIPDGHIANMIDHDAPIADQPDAVRNAFSKAGVLDPNDKRLITGADAYAKLSRQLASPDKSGDIAASEYLHQQGVPGIKYLDQFSRSPHLVDSSGTLISPIGYAEQGAGHLVQQQGSVSKAISVAERLGWNKEGAFYQDKEKYAALKEWENKGATVKVDGSRNLVLFDAKHARIVKKE